MKITKIYLWRYILFLFFLLIDVYSYVEDEMVDDPLLATHLAHFGINMINMEKVGSQSCG